MFTTPKEPPLNALDLLWHLGNFLAPACVTAALTAALVKLLWRQELRALRWRQLAGWGALGGSLALVLALLWLGQDGKMAGYGLLLLGIALPQWWLTIRR